MKSIADFVAGKIRRTESEASMRFDAGGEADVSFGAREGTLTGPAGSVTLYQRGMILADGSRVEWEAIARASRIENTVIEIDLREGTTKRIAGSEAGSEILYATLRWIGHALLHRKLAD